MSKSKSSRRRRPGGPPWFSERRGCAGAAALVGEHGRGERRRSADRKGRSDTAAFRRLAAAESLRPRPASMFIHTDRPGSDFMVDVIKSLGIEYVCRQSRLQLPRPARIAHQLRREQEAGIAHLLPRRIVGRHGARLRQDRRQADDDHGARHGRACSTPRWPSTTPTAIACRCTSCSATFWT